MENHELTTFQTVNSPSTPSTRHCRAPTESPTQGLAGVDPREEIVDLPIENDDFP